MKMIAMVAPKAGAKLERVERDVPVPGRRSSGFASMPAASATATR